MEDEVDKTKHKQLADSMFNSKWIKFFMKSDGVSSFLRAARAGNLDKILDFLNNGLDINSSNNNGLNALHLASKEGHMKVITELLARGAHVDAVTKKGNTALHIASLAGQEEVVKLLIERGSKVNVQSQNGFTPLYMASQENHSEVVRYLLANNANQALATEDGFTPLAVALQQGHDKVVALLLENDAKGKVKLPALHIAAKKDDVKATTLLLQNEHQLDTTSKSGGMINDTTKSGFTPLHIAAHYGNMSVGRLLVDRGADVNYKARNSITPLHVASKWGRVAMIQLLLDNNADIEAKTRDGLTPLHCAARSGHDQTVDILLERGASVTAKTKNSLTPLHMAAQGDHVDCVRLLLYRKAVIDDITIDYLTPLHVVAHCGNFRTAQLLLDRKCEVNARALNGFTPLHIACKKNRIKIVELLLKYGATIEATTESGLTPLHVASFMGHLNIVIYLLQKGASPNHTTVRGETSLHLAARANQTDILRALLRNGAQIDHAKAREQQTPLHIVARLGNVDNLLLLLQHGASPDALTKDMYTPLHIAAKEGHDEICQILLDHGAKQALKSKRGFTPLHIAAKNGQLRVVKRLVEHGANVDVEGKNGLTPLHVATHYDVVDVALYLLEKNANPHCTSKNGYTSLHIAAKKNEMEIALTLLQHGADANTKSKNGFTPLHLATQEGNVDMVAMLLEHSAGPNMQAKNGLVPLHLAAQEDGVPAAEILKHFGVNMNQQTNAGYTPLHTACHFGHVNMVKFLIENGASVNHRTQVGYTPLHQAAQQGHVMVINELLKSGASPDMLTESGQSALSIAQRLGYISVVEILKKVTEVNVEPCQVMEKYKHIFPETMQEVPMSDSDNEGGEEIIGTDPTFLYLANNELTLEESRYKGECDAFGFERSSEKYSCTSSPGAYIDDMKYISGQQKVMLSSREDFDADDDDEVKRMMTLKRKKMMNGVAEENMIASFSDASQTSVQPGEFNPDQLISMVRSAALLPQPPYVTPLNRHVQSCHEALERGSIPPGILNWKSFLVSFMVDARGGAMRGCRHSGVRFIIPPNNICMPTRITCRLVKRSKLLCPPPLMEGESLASRIIEMGPVGVKFAGLIIIEVPHFASLSGKEREILILRSENGETWKEHNFFSSCKISKEAVTACLNELEATEELSGSQQSQHYTNNQQQHQQHHQQQQQRKICRILSSDLPQYFALVTRIKQETSTIGPEGGIISSTVVPQVQAVFPEGSLTKNTKVGLQVQPVSAELVSKYGGNRVAVSSVVTIEPRRRKFHRPITLTLPSPKAAQKGMVNNYGPGSEAPSVRLLCSIVGGTNAALWEDITDTTPLVFTNNCVSFTTSISARFWLMDCQNTQETVKMASDIYPDVTLVPFLCKFAVFARRTDAIEARLRAFCITDDKCDKILESHDRFELISRSRDVEVLEGRPLYVEMAGNLVPVSKNNEQVCLKAFTPFVENRLPFVVRLRDHHQDPAGLLAFMSEPREVRSRNDKPPTPVVTLNINLPQYVPMEDAIKQDDIVFREKYEPMKRRRDERLSKTEQWIMEVSKNMLEDDYAKLGLQLGLDVDDVEKISKQFADVNEKALVVMQAWTSRCPESATGAHLEEALKEIGRSDLADLCPCDVINVTHAVGQAASKVFLDSTGFEALRVELGASSKGSSITRGMSLDVSYDEQDLIKDSGSTMDEFSDIGSTADKFGSQDEVDEVRDDTATPTKEDLPTPIKGSPSLDGFEEEEEEEDEEEMSTIKRKPKLIEEEDKIIKRAVHKIGAIPIEIPIATKVITESRLSEIESSYDKSQSRVVNKLNPEPEFEQVELKKPPGYVKDQVRRWENVLTEVDDARSESPPVDADSDQHVGEQQNGIWDEHSRESISTNDIDWHGAPQELKESDVDGRSEEKGDEIAEPTDVLLRQTAKDTVFKVLENLPAEKESLKFAPQLQQVASTSGMTSPQVMEAQIHNEERNIPTSSSYDYKNWEKRAAMVCQEDDDQGDTNLTLPDYAYAAGNHIIDLSFEEKDLIKQSESTDEDDESSLVSSVIDRSELDRKTSERDDSLDKEPPLIKWEENFEDTDNLQQRPDKVDLLSDIETDISKSPSKSPSEIQNAEIVLEEPQTPAVSPVESHDVYKYIPDTDCYEYRKYRQSETGHQVEIKSDDVMDDITIEMAATDDNRVDHKEPGSVTNVEKVRKGLELLCHGDGEAVTLLQENLVDVKQVKAGIEESEPDVIGQVYVQSVVTESPPCTTTIEKKHSLPNGVEVDHKIVTTTKTTTLIHTFHSPESEDAKDFPQQGQETTFEEPSFVVTTENVVEVTEKKCVGVQQFLLEDNQEATRRTTETKSTEVVIERRSGTLEQSAAEVEESKPTEPEESLLEGTVQTVLNRDDEFLDHLGLDIGPVITVTEDNSSPVDDDDFVGYYGLQSYMREQHDDSDIDVDFDEEGVKQEEILKDQHGEDKFNDASITSPKEDEHEKEDLLELELSNDIMTSSSKNDVDDVINSDEDILDVVDAHKDAIPDVIDAEDSEADGGEAVSDVDAVKISVENEDKTCSIGNEIVIEKADEAPSDTIACEYVPAIETFDETLFRKLSEHIESESVAKVDKPLTRSFGLLSFPEICIQAASPMAQSPEEDTQEFEEDEIHQVCEEIQKDGEIVCEGTDNIFVDQVKETILTEELEFIGDEVLGGNICAEIILGSEIPVSEKTDGEVKDMMDFSDGDMENEKLSEIHKSKKVVLEDYVGKDVIADTDLPTATDHRDVLVENSSVESSVNDFCHPSVIHKPDVLLDLCVTESEKTEQTDTTEDEAYYDKIASEKVKEIMMESCKIYNSEEVSTKYDSIPTVTIEPAEENAEDFDYEKDNLKLDQVEPDLESSVPEAERVSESHGQSTDEVQKSEADLLADDNDDDDEELEMKARMLALNILEDLREVMTSWDEESRPVEQSKDDQFGFKMAEWDVSSENLKMECLSGAPNSCPSRVLESPLSDFAAPDHTGFDQLSSFERQRFVIPVDSSSLMATSTSSANSELTDGRIVSKEIESVEEKDVDEKEQHVHPRGRHVIIVDEDDDYADDESDSTKPEKGIGENEKEFAEDEEFEKMDTRDGDELCWVGPQDMEISDDDEDVSKSLTEVNATKDSKDDRKSSTIVKRVSSDSILNDPTPEQHPPVSHFQLGLNFQQDFPRAPFHTPVKISPSDSCYDFGQMQYSLDAEMSGRDAQKSSKALLPFELKPEDLERKLSRCSGGSSTSSSVSTSSSSGHESQENGAKGEDRGLRCESQAYMGKSPEIVDGVLPNRSLAERVFSAIETSFASSQEALSSPDNVYKSVNQDLIEEHLEKVSRERLSTSSPIEPSHQSIVDSSILSETFRSPLMSPFSDLASSGNNIFSEILSSQISDESPASVQQKSRLGNVRVGQSPSDFITEVEECEEEDVQSLAKEGADLIDLAESSSEVKTDVRQDDDNDWSEDADYCYVCIENVKNYLIVQKNREEVRPLNVGGAKEDGADETDKEDRAEDKYEDDDDHGVDENMTDAAAIPPRESLDDGEKEVMKEASEPSDKVDEMYREAVLDHITRFCMNSSDTSETSPVAFFSDTYTVNKLRCKQLSDELTDDVLTPDALFPSTHTPQNKTMSGRFEFKTENVASCADICDDSDLCMQQAIQDSLRACHVDYRDDCSDQGQDDFYSDGITSETFIPAESPNKSEKPDTLMLSEILSGHGFASTLLDSALSPKTESKTHCSSSSSTRIEDYSLNFDPDTSNQLAAGPTEVRSMSSEDVPEASTSSDTSAEPTILAATYDLELGAVSRVVAAYDISPDTVEKKLANIQVESTLKRIMSSPEDDVFEQQQDEDPEPHDDNDDNSSQEVKSDNDCHDEENSKEDEEDVTVRSVTPPELSTMPEEIDVNESSDFMLSPSWDLCPELDHKSSIDSVGDAEFAQQADDEQSFDEGSPFESFQAREMIVSDEFAYDGRDNIYDEEEYGGETDVLDDAEDQDYKDRGLQATNICSEKYSLSDDFSSTISPISKNVFEDWQPDSSDVFAETQLDDEDIEEDHSPKVSSNGSLRSGSHSDAEVAGIDFVLTKAEEEHHDGNENDSLEYYCWKPRQRGEDCDDSSIISSNTEASYGSYCLNSQKNNGHEMDKPTSPLPVDMLMLGKVYDSYSAEEGNEDEEDDDGDGDDEAERVVTPQSDTSECTEKKLSEIVMDMMDEMASLETFDPFTVCYDDESSVDKDNKSIDFVSQQLEGRERCVEQMDLNLSIEADDEGLEKSDSFEEVTEEMLAERKAEEFVSAVVREAYLENENSEHNMDYNPSGEPSSPLGLSGISVHVTKEWDKESLENNDYDEESKHCDDDYDDEEDENGDGPIENDYLSSQALDYSEAVTKSLSSEDDVDQMEEDYQAGSVDDCEADVDGREESESYHVLSRSCEHKVMTVKRHPAGFTCKFSPKALTKNTHHQFRDPGQRCLDDSISPDDQGDSSSLDSFATVIGPSAHLEERVGDLSSLASSIHSDILPLEFAPTGDNLKIDFDSPETSKLELSCSILNTEFPATQQLHARKENQEESVKLITSFLQPCPDNLEATSSEESALDSDAVCLEDEEGQSSSARSDDELLNDPGDRPYGDRMLVVEYCDTMLATIREEEERLSSLSGKTSSSSSARLAESKQQQLLQLQQQQLQQKKQQQQKNADKDTASVSSSLLEFERLEKELQEKSSNADSNGSMRTHGPRGPEGSSNETDEKASSSHSGEVAAEDNLSISSSLAEFEQLEDELKHSPSSEKVSSASVSQGASIQSIKKDSVQSGGGGLMGSNTSLQSFSIVTGSPNFEGDTNFIQPTDVGSSLLEDFYDLTSKMSDQSASFVTDLVVLDQDGRESRSEDSSVHSSSKYPGYQDIVQIIRDAAESDQLVSGNMMLNRSAFSDELPKSQTVIPALENSAESGAWTQSDSSFVALCTNSQASLSNLISLEDSMVSSALDDPSQTREGQRQSKDESVKTSMSENEPEKFAERLCQAVLKSVTQREEIRVQRSTTEVTSVTSGVEEEGQEDKDNNFLES